MMMKKGFAAMCLMMVLSMGTVATANSRPTVPTTAAATSAQAVPTPPDRKSAGPTLAITSLNSDVADENEARVSVKAGGVLRNTNKTPINLRDVKVLLQDAEGKVSIPARIEAVGGGKETLGRGEEAEVRLTFENVPTDARALHLTLGTPTGGTVINALTITITCSYPPLRCRIDLSWD